MRWVGLGFGFSADVDLGQFSSFRNQKVDSLSLLPLGCSYVQYFAANIRCKCACFNRNNCAASKLHTSAFNAHYRLTPHFQVIKAWTLQASPFARWFRLTVDCWREIAICLCRDGSIVEEGVARWAMYSQNKFWQRRPLPYKSDRGKPTPQVTRPCSEHASGFPHICLQNKLADKDS